MTRESILMSVERYYSAKLREHGAGPRGVDWNSRESQILRFDQLLNVCDTSAPYRLIDVGCGYGSLLDHLRARGDRVEYLGFDLSAPMIAEARRLHPGDPPTLFRVGQPCGEPADYVVASGIFNVKQETPDGLWHDYIIETVRAMAGLADRGFAFNLLTTYSDAERRRPDLHYADPCWFFDHCKRNYSRHVSLFHDYGLYEFTILVRLELDHP
jgi:SAM-dependent methyltransferase